MFAFAMIRGVKSGWLKDKAYTPSPPGRHGLPWCLVAQVE